MFGFSLKKIFGEKEKCFEDQFSQLQVDMVDICLEYVEDRAEKIFIYCACEDNMMANIFFYQINGQIVWKHKLNDALKSGEPKYDVSIERQKKVVNIINEDLKSLKEVCLKHHQKMPVQIKLVYDVLTHKLDADYQYEPILGKTPGLTIQDVAEEWYQAQQLAAHQ